MSFQGLAGKDWLRAILPQVWVFLPVQHCHQLCTAVVVVTCRAQ